MREASKRQTANTQIQKFTEKEAAHELGVSPRTLRRWRQKGAMPYVRAGAFIWYTPACFEQFFKQNSRNLAA